MKNPFKFIERRKSERRAHEERVRRWEDAMERWEGREMPAHVIKFDHNLTEEDVKRIRENFERRYRNQMRRGL